MAALLLCLGLLLAAVQFSPVDSALPCNHPLRKYFPVYFGHCQSLCSYGPWGPWQPSVIEPNATCLSGQQRKYNRTRTAVPANNCPHTFEYFPECKQPQTGMNLELSMYCCVFFYIGIPTLEEKATQLIRSLRLAADANPATQHPVTYPMATQTGTQTTTTTTPSSKINATEPPTTNSPRPCSPTDGGCKPYRGRRQAPIINYCPNPSEQANNRICPNMCDKDRPRRPIGVPCSKCTMHSGTSLVVPVVTVCVCV